MSNLLDLDFSDLEPVKTDVQIQGKSYVLTEPSGDAVCKYRNMQLKSTKMSGSDKGLQITSIEGIADTEPYLVSLCLYEVSPDGSFKTPVPVGLIRSWPARVQKRLFDWINKAGNLSEDDSKEAIEKRIKEDTAKLEALNQGESSLKN